MRNLSRDEVEEILSHRERAVETHRLGMAMTHLAEAREMLQNVSSELAKCDAILGNPGHREWFEKVELYLGQIWQSVNDEFVSEIAAMDIEAARAHPEETEDDMQEVLNELNQLAQEKGFTVLGGKLQVPHGKKIND